MNISTLGSNPLYFTDQIKSSTRTQTVNGTEDQPATKSFGQVLSETLEEVNSSQINADQMTESFLTGGPVEIHQMLIAVEKADLALRQTVEIRNKLVDAYKQIANMQI